MGNLDPDKGAEETAGIVMRRPRRVGMRYVPRRSGVCGGNVRTDG